MNLLADFIGEKYQERIQAQFEEKHAEEIEPDIKGVTVRIRIHDLNTIDNMARYLNISRQQLLSSFVEGGISQAFESLAYASLQSKCALPEYPTYGDRDAYEEKVRELVEEERFSFIKVLTK